MTLSEFLCLVSDIEHMYVMGLRYKYLQVGLFRPGWMITDMC